MTQRPRRLPWVADSCLVRNEVGVFVAQPVGDCNYTTGLHIYAHLAEDAEAASGLMAFHAVIGLDGTVAWEQMQPEYKLGHDRADELFPVMLKIAQDWIERDAVHYVLHIRDMALRELQGHRRKLRDLERGIQHLEGLLSDPDAPLHRNQKGEDGEWRVALYTPEERRERRYLWGRNLALYKSNLDAYRKTHASRIAQLIEARIRLDAFIATKLKCKAADLFPLPAAREADPAMAWLIPLMPLNPEVDFLRRR